MNEQWRTPGDHAQRLPWPVIENKLVVPPLPERLVSRPRLHEALDHGTAGSAVLLSAAPGSGKTVALASWVRHGSPPGPVAWLSLDASDNDPVRFGRYVVTALCRSGAVPPDNELWSTPARTGDDSLLPRIADAVRRLGQPVVLVLDDVHEVTDVRVRTFLESLLRHAQPHLRFVMAARWDPLLSLHRLTLDGALVQLRADDLAFTPDEVVELMDKCGHLGRLSHRDVQLLHARTEGWAAGLRLAAASMDGQPDLHRFVRELAGEDQSLAGYLISEVLARQPEDRRRFLLETSVVDELTIGLADALTQRDDAALALAELERTNSFVSAVDSHRERYRYHPLFAELLRYEMRKQMPERVADVRRRAASWYRDHDAPVEAMRQAAALEDWWLVADVLLQHGFAPLLRGSPVMVDGLLEHVPPEAMTRRPELAVLSAAHRVLAGEDWAGTILQQALDGVGTLPEDRRGAFGVVLGACWMVHATTDGDLDGAMSAGWYVLDLARELPGWESRDGAVRDSVLVTLRHLGAVELWLGEVEAASDHLRRAHRGAMAAGMVAEAVASLGYLAMIDAIRGRLRDARAEADAALARAAEAQLLPTVSAPATMASAYVHYLRDELPAAAECLDRLTRVKVARNDPLRVAARVLEGRCRFAEGDAAGAMKRIQSARRDLVHAPRARLLTGWLVESETSMQLLLGDLPAARWTLRSAVIGGPTPSPLLVASARLKLAEGDPDAAVQLVQGFMDDVGVTDDLAQRLQVGLVLMVALHAQGLTHESGRILHDLVAAAEVEDHRRLFLDAGAPAKALLAAGRNWSDSMWPFLDEVALAATDPVPDTATPAPVHVEPLSEREWDVLRYLPTMLTFAEIGSELYISVNTTKSHVRNIYRKLGVEDRREAVRRARQFQLLRP